MLGYYNYTVVLTYIGMLTGFIGISCTVDGQYHAAVLCLMASGVCDMFDGAIASTKKRNKYEKHFGIEIDSLSDLICFGILPALLLYCIAGRNIVSLLIGSVYALCALIRLAYFNVDEVERQNQSSGLRTIYQGLPVTLSALILPVLYQIGISWNIKPAKLWSWALVGMAVAFLMPFQLKKPNIIGKICMIFCGCFELLFLLAGADL